MKNLHFALEVVALLDIPVEFGIYGPIDDEKYWRKCQTRMEVLPRNIKATYYGSVAHSEVPRVMESYDLFFLPTLGENYGHVIIEALVSGTPVLISDRTPWNNLERDGAGWAVPLDSARIFSEYILKVQEMDPNEYLFFRSRAQQYALRYLSGSDAVGLNRDLLLRLVDSIRIN